MIRWRRGAGGALGVLAVLATSALSVDARAEDGGTINGFTHNGTNIKLSGPPEHLIVDRRDSNANPEWISFLDCNAGLKLKFTSTPVIVGGNVSSYEVWVTSGSSDCLTGESRTNSTCRQVYANNSPSGTTSLDIEFLAKEDLIVKGLGEPGCSFDHSLPAIQMKIYFMLIRSTDPDVATEDYALWEGTQVDLWGPDKPDSPEVTAGDGSLSLKITPNGSDTAKFLVFRDPPPDPSVNIPTTGAGGSGGSGGAGGSGGGTTTTTSGSGGSDGGIPSSCAASDILIPGEIPSAYLQYRVADTVEYTTGTATATSVLKDLTNNVNYRVAAAGIDTVGNLGKLSELACGVPKPVDSFFKIYCQDGGTCAGCSFGIDPDFGWPALATAAFFTVGLRARRKTRARRAARQEKVS